jgi:diguanylate cyclase (GGDEF)-like protein
LRKALTHWGYELVEAADGDEAWELLQQPDAPQLAIVDWMMPGLDGVEICRRLRARTEAPYVYVILLTGIDDRNDLAAGLVAGADAYIIKPFDHHDFHAHLHSGKRILNLQTALLEAQEKLRIEASHDALTTMWNRRAIMQILNKELARARRQKSAFSIAMSDIDHFKVVNDTHGHLAGDAVLREVARRVDEIARDYDTVGRYGGEEFLIVLPACDQAGAVAAAERMRASVASAPVEAHGVEIPVTLSLGVATSVHGRELKETEDFIAAADAALYRAKEGGRNRLEVATPEELARGAAKRS